MELKIVPQTEVESSVSLGEAVKEQRAPTQAEKLQAIKAIKQTGRNDLCPCGCGKKVKKCPNGRRVLEFKKMFRGLVIPELVFVLLFLAFFIVVMFNLREQYFACKQVGKEPVATWFGCSCADTTSTQTNR